MAYAKKRLHLDFHNHPSVMGIGEHLSVAQFREYIKELGLDSVVLCAKCHHGMSYYLTDIGTTAPGMKKSILDIQIEACEAEGVHYHLYLSVLRDNYTFDKHPDWRFVGPTGETSSVDDEYRIVCANTPYYQESLFPQIRELTERYSRAAGIWLDIIRYPGETCCCPNCTRDAQQLGLSLMEFSHRMLIGKYSEIKDYLAGKQKQLTLNSIVFQGNAPWRHLTPPDVESVLAHVGPFFFPLYSRYLGRQEGEKYGITHVFYQNWREHGTLKHWEQLRYEICQMVFANFDVSLGDQLEPDGHLDLRRFKMLRKGFRLIDELRSICEFSLPPVSEVGIVVSQMHATAGASAVDKELDVESGAKRSGSDPFALGGIKALLEMHYQCTAIDPGEDFSPYSLLILQASVLEIDGVISRLDEYMRMGGKAIVMGSTGTKGAEWFGLRSEGWGNAAYQYLELSPDERILIKSRAQRVDPSCGRMRPVYNSYLPFRDKEIVGRSANYVRPIDPDSGHSSVFLDSLGCLLYSIPDIFSDYYNWGNWAHREVISRFIGFLGLQPLVSGKIPASAQVTLHGSGSAIELRVLDCSLKWENIPFAHETEYDLERRYQFLLRLNLLPSDICDRESGESVPFTFKDNIASFEVRTCKPYFVMRVT